jgi:DNA-binding MarR family transcriptional regulator
MNLDLCEWRIIQVLGAVERATIFDIADRIAMDRGGTSRAISRLEKTGLVERQVDRVDRRRSYIALSDAGQARHDQIIGFAVAREERLLQKLSPEDRAHLRKMLRLLIEESELMLTQQWTP